MENSNQELQDIQLTELRNNQTHRVVCPFCGADDSSPIRKTKNIVKCNKCGGTYLQVVIDSTARRLLYQDHAEIDTTLVPPENPAEAELSDLSRENFLTELLSFIKPKGVLLDIGSAWGAFLNNARRKGFVPKGIEIVNKYADYSREKLNIETDTNDFLETDYEDNSLSVISMIHSLHLFENPRKVVDKALKVLKPQGVLCGIVPNFDSFASDILEDEWEWIDPDFHLVYYTPFMIMDMLQDAGFIIELIYTTTGDFNQYLLVDIVKRLFRITNKNDIEMKIDYLSADGKGEEIRFIARKPGISKEEEQEEKPKAPQKEEKKPEEYKDTSLSEIEIIKPDYVKPLINELEINFKKNDNFEEVLFAMFNTRRTSSKLIIRDDKGILPEYAAKWNGAIVKSATQRQAKHEEAPVKQEPVTMEMPLVSDHLDVYFSELNGKSPKQTDVTNDTTSKVTVSATDLPMSTGKLPDPLPSPLLLNLGCGRDIREGFINIDIYGSDPRIVQMDVRKLDLPDNSADLIVASNIIQCLPYNDTSSALTEWARVLKPGKDILIDCPSLRMQAKAYLEGTWDADLASMMIFGNQSSEGEFTRNAFDRDTIRKHLLQTGFEVVDVQEDRHEYGKISNYFMTVRARKAQSTAAIGSEGASDSFMSSISAMSASAAGIRSVSLADSAEITPDMIMETKTESNADQLPELNVVWEGSQFLWHSHALVNREHCSNIIDSANVNLSIVPFEKEEFSPVGNDKYEKLAKYDIRNKPASEMEVPNKPFVWIRHQLPVKDEEPSGARWIIMHTSPYSILQKSFFDTFSRADEIWTPSDYSRKSIINSGIDSDKVAVIPHGIDPAHYRPSGDKYYIPTVKKLKFLFVGNTIHRRGIDILLEAFVGAFGSKDEVMLFVKDFPGNDPTEENSTRETIARFDNMPETPQIIYYSEDMSEEQMANLYRSCDVFVLPYRSVGFSLSTLEAMACGLPVIVTKGGSTDDFVDEKVGWQIKSNLVNIGKEISGNEFNDEAYLFEPDTEDLMNIFLSIYENPSVIKPMGLKASHRARTSWTWKRATMKLFFRLDKIYGTTLYKTAYGKLTDNVDGNVSLSEATSFYNKEQYNEAAVLYQKAIDSYDLNDDYKLIAFYRLALIAAKSGDYVAAEQFMDKASRVRKVKIDRAYLEANILTARNNYKTALELLSDIFDNWKDWKFDTVLGLTLDRLLCETADIDLLAGDRQSALKMYSEALLINDNNAKACLGMAKAYLMIEAKEEADKMLLKALTIDPEFEEALSLLNESEKRE